MSHLNKGFFCIFALSGVLFSQAPSPQVPETHMTPTGQLIVTIPNDTKVFQEQSLPEDMLSSSAIAGQGMANQDGKRKIGLKRFKTQLKAKETLIVKLTAMPLNEMLLTFGLTEGMDPDMHEKMRRINGMQGRLRRPTIEITNTTDQECSIILVLRGSIEISYKLEFVRKDG